MKKRLHATIVRAYFLAMFLIFITGANDIYAQRGNGNGSNNGGVDNNTGTGNDMVNRNGLSQIYFIEFAH